MHERAQQDVRYWLPPSPCQQTFNLPRVCILFGTTRGDNAQLLNLALALNWPFDVKGEVNSVPMTIVDRLSHAVGLRIRQRKQILSSLLWPDVILITGGRRVVDALRIQEMSEGRSKIVCVGRPWADLDLFDLVITTPQYRLPKRPNVLMNAMPLNQPSADALRMAAAEWRSEIEHLPKPWIALLVGGDSGSCRFAEDTGKRLARKANALASAIGGSLLISTSGRTSSAAARALFDEINVPCLAFRWDKPRGPNPHLGFLALADRFIVTSDSASMIAEAVSTGRPVSIFEVPLRARSRWMTWASGPGHIGERLRRRMTAKGLWIPARDMKAYHDNLVERGYVQATFKADERFTPAHPDDLKRAAKSILELFPGIASPAVQSVSPEPKRSQDHGLAPAD